MTPGVRHDESGRAPAARVALGRSQRVAARGASTGESARRTQGGHSARSGPESVQSQTKTEAQQVTKFEALTALIGLASAKRIGGPCYGAPRRTGWARRRRCGNSSTRT